MCPRSVRCGGRPPACACQKCRSASGVNHPRVVVLGVGGPGTGSRAGVDLERILEVVLGVVPALRRRGRDPEVAGYAPNGRSPPTRSHSATGTDAATRAGRRPVCVPMCPATSVRLNGEWKGNGESLTSHLMARGMTKLRPCGESQPWSGASRVAMPDVRVRGARYRRARAFRHPPDSAQDAAAERCAGTSISRLRILPVGPLGSSSTNHT
jgi:hypothetical protein